MPSSPLGHIPPIRLYLLSLDAQHLTLRRFNGSRNGDQVIWFVDTLQVCWTLNDLGRVQEVLCRLGERQGRQMLDERPPIGWANRSRVARAMDFRGGSSAGGRGIATCICASWVAHPLHHPRLAMLTASSRGLKS